MNRKQRRMATKLGKQAVPPSGAGATAEAHHKFGNALRQQNKLDEAMAHYQRAIVLKPDFAEAHCNLGNALHIQGRLDEALAHYKQAVALKPGFAEAHYNLGNALHKRGKLDEAASHYERAIVLGLDLAEAHNNLGDVLQDQGKLDKAAVQYHRALALNAGFAGAHNSLGNVLNRQGKLNEAAAEYQRALALRPELAEAHNNLGVALQHQGKTAEAAAQYRRALTLAPADPAALSNLGKALMAAGDPAGALKAIQRSIEIDESENAKLLFVECLRSLNFIPDGIDLRDNLTRALSEPWGRPSDLARFTAIFLKRNGPTSLCMRRVNSTWPRRPPPHKIFNPAELAEICNDRVLLCLLEATIVCDVELERFLTIVRQTMLAAASESREVDENQLRFFCALAQQCFINEYIFAHADREKEMADRMRSLLVDALASRAAIPELWVVAVAAFFPLASLPAVELLVDRRWSSPVSELVARQVTAKEEERQLQASVSHLTTIEDLVSLAVKQQYEENPYPRWMKPAPVGQPMTIDAYLRSQFPLVDLRNVSTKSGAEILVAGCGTGQHSIETARRFRGTNVLAVDLSLTSLCYAKRKTRELGLNNIEYAQADILQLQSIGRTFDVIEAVGVLHHLADPIAGWRVLLSMLRPGGFMCLGLYSELARQDVVAARSFIAERNYGPSAVEIRRCRQELTGLSGDTLLAKVAQRVDFFSTSTCRDLLFHVQEHLLNLPEISSFLHEDRLDFLGFNLPSAVLQNYRQRFPNDATMTDLASWHIFETENPSTFAGMYQFWIRKAD